MLAGRLQRSTTSLAARVEDAVRIRLHLPSATGSGAALCRGLRASSRRYHRPTGQIQQPGRTQDWIKLGGKVILSRARPDAGSDFGQLRAAGYSQVQEVPSGKLQGGEGRQGAVADNLVAPRPAEQNLCELPRWLFLSPP